MAHAPTPTIGAIVSMPTGTDLSAFWAQMGIDAPPSVNWDRTMASTIREFESATGYIPFLAPRYLIDGPDGPTSTTRTFTLCENSRLDLRGGMMFAVSVTVDGTLLTEGVDADYSLIRLVDNGPVRYIKFNHRTSSREDGVVVVGYWGYTDSCPAEIFEALLRKAAAKLLPITQGGIGQMVRIQEGPVEYQYQGATVIQQFESAYLDVVAGYRR